MKSTMAGHGEPPTVGNPLPRSGNEPGIELLQRWMRETQTARRSAAWSESERAALARLERALSGSLSTATSDEVQQAVGGLFLHYSARVRTEVEAQRVVEDFIEDLRAFPIDIVRAACRAWRRSEREFAPTPGQLIALAGPILKSRLFYRDLARRALGVDHHEITRKKAG